jgi:hypothetical protein
VKQVVFLVNKKKTGLLCGLLFSVILGALIYMILKEPETEYYVYTTIEGESSNWKLVNYEVVFTPSSMREGGGELIFIGDKNRKPISHVSGAVYFGGKSIGGYSHSYDSRYGSILLGGGGIGTPGSSRKISTNYVARFAEDDRYIIITWIGVNLEKYTEKIDLNIPFTINIKNK